MKEYVPYVVSHTIYLWFAWIRSIFAQMIQIFSSSSASSVRVIYAQISPLQNPKNKFHRAGKLTEECGFFLREKSVVFNWSINIYDSSFLANGQSCRTYSLGMQSLIMFYS